MGRGGVPVGYPACYRLSTHCRIIYSPFHSIDNVTISLFMYTLINLSLSLSLSSILFSILSTIFLCKSLAIKLIIIKDQVQLKYQIQCVNVHLSTKSITVNGTSPRHIPVYICKCYWRTNILASLYACAFSKRGPVYA